MGASHARLLSAEDAKAVISDVLDDIGKQLVDDIGDSVRYGHLDVSNAEQRGLAVAIATGELGKLDVLVSNAGIVNGSPIQKFRLDKWQPVVDVI